MDWYKEFNIMQGCFSHASARIKQLQAENEQMRKDGHNPSWRATHDRCLELIGDNRQLREENEKLKVELDDREIRRAEAIFRRVTAENEALKEVK